jgi:hypothetical protein
MKLTKVQIVILVIVSIVAICVLLSCTGSSDNFEKIPSCSDYTKMIRQQMTVEQAGIARKVFGQIDTLHVVAQIVGSQSSLTQEILLDSLISNIKKFIPQVVIVKGLYRNEASLLLLLDLKSGKRDLFYGFVSVELSRKVEILRTKYETTWEVWSDDVTFCEERDPQPRIWWLVQLQATKFAAMWTIGNR